jgi:excisionase family DNA binding protein
MEKEPEIDRLIRLDDAARLLGVSTRTLRDWTTKGKFDCVRTPGGQRRFRLSDIEAVIRKSD